MDPDVPLVIRTKWFLSSDRTVYQPWVTWSPYRNVLVLCMILLCLQSCSEWLNWTFFSQLGKQVILFWFWSGTEQWTDPLCGCSLIIISVETDLSEHNFTFKGKVHYLRTWTQLLMSSESGKVQTHSSGSRVTPLVQCVSVTKRISNDNGSAGLFLRIRVTTSASQAQTEVWRSEMTRGQQHRRSTEPVLKLECNPFTPEHDKV